MTGGWGVELAHSDRWVGGVELAHSDRWVGGWS